MIYQILRMFLNIVYAMVVLLPALAADAICKKANVLKYYEDLK